MSKTLNDLTPNEFELYSKCVMYRSTLTALLRVVALNDTLAATPEYAAACALLGTDYGHEGRCLFDPGFWK